MSDSNSRVSIFKILLKYLEFIFILLYGILSRNPFANSAFSILKNKLLSASMPIL